MTKSHLLLTTSRISLLETLEADSGQRSIPNYTLKWKARRLWVSCKLNETVRVPALKSKQWLQDCLNRSFIQAVYIDLSAGEAELKQWAESCHQANLQAFVRLPTLSKLPQKQWPLKWVLKRSSDWLVAALLLLLLSPLMLILGFLVRFTSSGPIFYRQWRVGHRGKLFQIIKFRTMKADAEKLHNQVMANQPGLHKCKDDPRITQIGRWMRKFSLDELPQLLNVLRGEMSLVGPRPWALYDAVRIEPELQGRLNAVPGITGAWQVTTRSHNCDLASVNRMDLDYLHQWTFRKDLKFLLLTAPKVFTGFGAY
ncbi:sugar transferase [Romeria aff. gracilis LEGE 07310]|uniref:Sugar transferase n=1 Tax=Vasconcelosia minhoensis LEGE 07310 TaxID=915328 RepID=A0A8J7ALD9_9CYAN|nr:heterocyst development glycosyltransferase HepC [Romeria gracilis]MBE9076321.1 sugar transferase [Romeria aff. gracilis LEGE 07310]